MINDADVFLNERKIEITDFCDEPEELLVIFWSKTCL